MTLDTKMMLAAWPLSDRHSHDGDCTRHYAACAILALCDEVDSLRAKGDALADAVDRLITEAACQVLSHRVTEYHDDTVPCPVAVRIESALAEWRGR